MKFSKSLGVAISTLLFTLFFYKNELGLNVGLFTLVTIALMFWLKPDFFKHTLNKIAIAIHFLFGLTFSLYGSPFTLLLYVLSFVVLFGLHTQEPIRNLVYAGLNIFSSYFSAWGDLLSKSDSNSTSRFPSRFRGLLRIIVLPLVVIGVFLFLYSIGNAQFGKLIANSIESFFNYLERFIRHFNPALIACLFIGILVSVIHAKRNGTSIFSEMDQAKNDNLIRRRERLSGLYRFMDLKNEYKSGVFLFACLNLILIVLLGFEMKHVWFNFNWKGEYLKPLVHEGTYILIVSIVLSIIVTAYFFRKNLNFYKGNALLVVMAKIWIVLNALLVISVCVRNSYYIEYFALAYKRIGVYFFLALCLVGLITLWIKVMKRKSSYFLIRINALALYIGLALLSSFNWDVIIAKYNIAHSDKAFLHLSFIKTLSNKALPYLVLTDEQMQEIEENQLKAIPFAKPGYFEMENYKSEIDARIESFCSQFESKNALEKSFAEKRAYQLLKK